MFGNKWKDIFVRDDSGSEMVQNRHGETVRLRPAHKGDESKLKYRRMVGTIDDAQQCEFHRAMSGDGRGRYYIYRLLRR